MGRDGQKQEELTRSGGWVVVKRDSGKCVRSGNGCAWVGFAGAISIIGQRKCNGSYIPYRPLERCVGVSVGTGRVGGDWRRRYGGGTGEGALRGR
jgi:hypothetical protein